VRENIPVIRVRNDHYDEVVVRDGIVLCFFMRRSYREIAPAVWRALQAYIRAIPPRSLGWYASDEGDMLPLDDKGWEHIRWTILERPWGIACHVSLSEGAGGEGRYYFDYDGRKLDDPSFSHDEGATSAVTFSFPTEYLLEKDPTQLRALALELGRELPFSFGYASLALVSAPGLWDSVRTKLLGLLDRYLGLDLYHSIDTSRVIGTGARGAYWLTFLGQPLLGQLGGLEGLNTLLTFPEVTFQPMEGGRLLLSLSEWPDPIDMETGTVPPQYRTLARLLEPYFCEEGGAWPPMTREFMHRWFRRLC
jgi:hypothetical protein